MSASADVTADVIRDPANCVPPGTASNDQGIGGYCSPGGGQCAITGPGGSPRICTADIAGTPAHAWFCTYPCPTNCGGGAACVTTAMGSECVPTSCDYLGVDASVPPVDAGADSGMAAEASSPSDAASLSDAASGEGGGD